MNINDILATISKMREDKRNKSRNTTPLSASKSDKKSISPVRPGFTSKPSYKKLENFISMYKPRDMLEYKKDAASLMVGTLQKFKKRIFNLLEKNLRNFILVEVCFAAKKGGKSSAKTKKPDLEEYHSPSFKKPKPRFSDIDLSHGLGLLSLFFERMRTKGKKFVIVKVKEFLESQKKQKGILKFARYLKTVLLKEGFLWLKSRTEYQRKAFDLRIDLRNISQKSEIIDFSSVDQSEVLFEPVGDNSLQFTSKFHSSVDRQGKDINLSSLICGDERVNTERVYNLERVKDLPKGDRFSYEYSECLSETKPLKKSRFLSKKSNSSFRFIQRPLGMLNFVIENHLKTHVFVILTEQYTVHRTRKALLKISKDSMRYFKFFVNVLKKINTLPLVLKRLAYLNRSHYLVLLTKHFTTWRVKPKSLTPKLLRPLISSIKACFKAQKLQTFFLLKSLLVSNKYTQKSSLLCLVNSLKRAVQVFHYKNKRISFSILNIVYKEFLIKYWHINKLLKHINKDIRFRTRVCYSLWKNSLDFEKSHYLQILSFVERISEVFESRKRGAFLTLSSYERSLLNLSYT